MNIMRQEQDSTRPKRPGHATASASHNRRHKSARMKKLRQHISLLEQLCRDIDPYQPLQPEHQQALEKLGIAATLDPYALTNHLILNLEDALAELQRLQEA